MKLSEWYTPYFMNLTNDGIGVDRTPTTGNNFVSITHLLLLTLLQISKNARRFSFVFPSLQWDYKNEIRYDSYSEPLSQSFQGLHQVRNFINN